MPHVFQDKNYQLYLLWSKCSLCGATSSTRVKVCKGSSPHQGTHPSNTGKPNHIPLLPTRRKSCSTPHSCIRNLCHPIGSRGSAGLPSSSWRKHLRPADPDLIRPDRRGACQGAGCDHLQMLQNRPETACPAGYAGGGYLVEEHPIQCV